jgi:hypothetical protein
MFTPHQKSFLAGPPIIASGQLLDPGPGGWFQVETFLRYNPVDFQIGVDHRQTGLPFRHEQGDGTGKSILLFIEPIIGHPQQQVVPTIVFYPGKPDLAIEPQYL